MVVVGRKRGEMLKPIRTEDMAEKRISSESQPSSRKAPSVGMNFSSISSLIDEGEGGLVGLERVRTAVECPLADKFLLNGSRQPY